MRINLTAIAVPIIAVAALSFPDRLPAAAATSGSCENAKTTLNGAVPTQSTAPKATGDVDKDFMKMEVAVTKAQMVIGHVVAKCSKNATNRQAALQLEQDAEYRMRLFRNQGTSL